MLGLEDSALKLNITLLQTILASEYVLATKTRNFHWNVRGKEFMMLHEMFGSMYDQINAQADEVAERIRQLEGVPNGSLNAFVKDSFIVEAEGPCTDGCEMIKCLIADGDKMVSQLRALISKAEANKDFGTMDLATKWMELHEKQLYFLRSH
jgi:starvation-inducible DNA-binding protein